MDLDEIDHKILEMLARDARVSMAALADTTHLSRAAVHARFTRLKTNGVISGFTIRVDPVLAGVHASAYVELTVAPPQLMRVHDQLCELAAVEYCARVSGNCDLIALVRARTVRSLGRDVIDRINAIPGVHSTRTLMVFSEWARIPPAPHDGPETSQA